jgi:hypothetical protein
MAVAGGPVAAAEDMDYEGVPPVESRERVDATKALDCIQKKDPKGEKTVAIADGARLYPQIAKDKGIPLYQCAHGNGQFQYNAPRGPLGNLPVNTGWIDNSWQMVKAAIPRGLHATKDGEPNPEVMQYVYSWSFRFHHRDAASREAAVGKLLKRERQKRRSS